MNSFGTFLKEKRLEKNLTQKDLAKILIVSESAVSKWEKDIARPDISLLPKLSEVLDVSEHELITASIDRESREEKVQAKKWRAFSMSWSLFFYIAYAIALIPCFICDLAINKTLSWFWIVVSALLLAFTFTNLPKLIKRQKLLILPLSMFFALCLLLGVCCAYTDGNWFWVSAVSILFGLMIIFSPIYISKYKIFSKIRKYNDFASIGIDFVMLNILLLVIQNYSSVNYNATQWYFNIALPIVLSIYLLLNIMLSVRFLKVNKFIKTSIVLFINSILYVITSFINVSNPMVQKEIDDLNIYNANFSSWIPNITLENNIHCIIFLIITILAVLFLIIGLLRVIRNKYNKK